MSLRLAPRFEKENGAAEAPSKRQEIGNVLRVRDYFFDLLMLSPGASSFAFDAPESFLTSPGAN